MAARYSRLPTADDSDQVAFDFGSAFEFGSSSLRNDDYKSVFTYNRHSHMREEDVRLTVVKQSFTSRICAYMITALCVLLCILTFPISAWFCIKMASDCEQIVLFRLGRLQKVRGSGIVFIIPCLDKWKKVDTRMKAFNVPPLQLLTMDAGIIEMGADVYYKVTDVVRSVTTVQNLNTALRGLVRNILSNHVVKYELNDIENKSHDLVAYIQAESNKTTESWGLSVCRVEFSPIKVLQAPQAGNSNGLPAGLGQDALTQMFQQVASAFMGQGSSSPLPQALVVPETEDASGAAVGTTVSPEDVSVAPGLTPRDIMVMVRGVLTDTLVRNVGTTYQFHLSGPKGGVFYMDLKNGSGRVGEGPEPSGNPDVILELTVQDMQKMFVGQINPLQSYMNGRLKVTGNLSDATRLEEVMQKVVQKLSSAGVSSSP